VSKSPELSIGQPRIDIVSLIMTKTNQLDAYGLPAQFKVRLIEDACGNVVLKCVSDKWAVRVGESNEYNGACDVFIQEAHVDEWVGTLPRAAFYGRGKNKRFNDNAVFLMDSWTFRQLVGGQSD
jgi:hypothetical protein